MKRSEALSKLDNLFWNTEHIDMPYVGPNGFTKLAEETLKLLEEMGMLPPPTQNHTKDHVFNSNEWEKEDENN